VTLEARRLIRASPERVFAHIAHAEHLPRYAAPLWMSADQAEKRGGAQVVTLRGYFAGLPVESVQRIVVHPPSSVEQAQIRGTLRALTGRFTLRSVEDGTEILYRIDADPAIPLITEDAARQFLVQFVERMLDRIKHAAERKTPSRARAAAPAVATALPEGDEEEAEEIAAAPESRAAPEVPAETGMQPPAPPAGPPAAAPVREHPAAARARAEPPRAPGQPPGPPGRRRRRRRHRRRSGGGTPSASPPHR
jgi:uncharacterized protein YndB with AHSA1/START domain